jgi:hypothetical protein
MIETNTSPTTSTDILYLKTSKNLNFILNESVDNDNLLKNFKSFYNSNQKTNNNAHLNLKVNIKYNY